MADEIVYSHDYKPDFDENKVEWVDSESPALSAENLNNINSGISESFNLIKSLGKYVDTNIKYIQVTANNLNENPIYIGEIDNWNSTIDPKKYIAVITDSHETNGYDLVNHVVFFPISDSVERSLSINGGKYIRVLINTNGEIYVRGSQSDITKKVTFDLLLLPATIQNISN